MSLDNFIINVFCWVDDEIKYLFSHQKLRSRGFEPTLSDSEVITMEIVSEFLGIDTDKGAWEYFLHHWLNWFPRLGSRANFAKHATNLWAIKQQLQESFANKLGAFTDTLHMADGFPMPVVKFKRAPAARVFKGEATYGYCASKAETYYGFKGNVLINSEGVVAGATVTAANIDERQSLWDILGDIKGLLIADKGLLGAQYQKEIYEYTGINLQTANRANMDEKRNADTISWLISTRRLVETVIGQLVERFNIEKIRARKTWQLTNRITRKILAHTICIFISKHNNLPPLQFDRLVTA
jgi:hypothetical protein